MTWSCDVLLHLLKLVLPGTKESTAVFARVEMTIMMMITMAMTNDDDWQDDDDRDRQDDDDHDWQGGDDNCLP